MRRKVVLELSAKSKIYQALASVTTAVVENLWKKQKLRQRTARRGQQTVSTVSNATLRGTSDRHVPVRQRQEICLRSNYSPGPKTSRTFPTSALSVNGF